ncbi:MAG: non-homologous end-joining DNA ligase [Limisphaerales bacterium]
MKRNPLEEYAGKRDFEHTREPGPRVKKAAPQKAGNLFVIQKHAASHLHYDFRLEMKGVLKSWAVPKGLPMHRGDKRLAMQVEDHPLDYAGFEGIIAPENYGAGTVMVWDTGTYEVKDAEPLEALESGKIHFILHGKKLKGEWAIIKIRNPNEKGKQPWLIFKAGEDLPELSAKKENESAISGRTMEKIAEAQDAEWESNRAAAAPPNDSVKARIRRAVARAKQKQEPAGETPLKNLRAGKISFVEPMKCKLLEEIPAGEDWIYEIKFDGIRALTLKNGDDVQLYSRLKNKMSHRFGDIAEAIRSLNCKAAILDGEIVALENSGRSSFQLLQMSRMPGQAPPICYYLFDILNLDGKDLKNLPLHERKGILRKVVPEGNDLLRVSDHLGGRPEQLWTEVCHRGLEGLIGKQRNSKYEPGKRSGAWIKVKCTCAQEFVIGGYTEPQGSREKFGAIIVGYYEGGKLMFASKVGSGFDRRVLESLYKQFQKLKQPGCPFANLPEKRPGRWGQGITASQMKRCTWVKPQLVAQVRFTEWTMDGGLRHPVFMGLREDKQPSEVVREKPAH